MRKYLLLLVSCILLSIAAIAQEEGDPLAPDPISKSIIPLDTVINIKLLSRDTVAFDYYSLYAFEHNQGNKRVYAEFLIPKKKDIYRSKAQQVVAIRLCKLTQFVNSFAGIESKPIEVGDYIEITKDNGKDKQYYNFDPSLPNPVLCLCEPIATKTDTH